MSKHLARKGAFFYTYTWNMTFGEKVGMYPKFNPTNTDRYKRASVFMKAMMKDFKMSNYSRTPLYRGLSQYEWKNLFHKGTRKLTRNTFTSFTRDFGVAASFADSDIVLEFNGSAKTIEYDMIKYVSVFGSAESEVLFPPGTFTIDSGGPTRFRGNKQIIKVRFTPKKGVDFNKLEHRANVRFKNRYIKHGATIHMSNNMNERWKQHKVNNLRATLKTLANDRNKIINIHLTEALKNNPNIRKLAILNKMHNRINALKTNIQRRINRHGII